MKLELAAAALRRWGRSSEDTDGDSGYHAALRAGSQVRESEEGVDLLLACAVGVLVAVSVILIDRWLKKSTAKPADEPAKPDHAFDGRGRRRSRIDEAPVTTALSSLDFASGFTTLVFGDIKTQEKAPEVDEPLAKEDLCEELLALSQQDLLWVLKAVARSRGDDMLVEAAQAISRPSSRRATGAMDGQVASSFERKETISHFLPQLRFSSFQYYAEEGEELTVRVVRVGNMKERSVVSYRTRDRTAKAGQNYVPLCGQLTFEPGEHTKELQVQIKENDVYEPSLELIVELLEDDIENACLDKDLWTAAVEIMDNDVFPTNAYQNDIDPEALVKDASALDGLDQKRLLWEFIKFCMTNSTIYWGMAKMMATDQLENLYGFINLLMSVYLVDYVVVTTVPDSSLFISRSREVSLLVVTACLVLPLFGLHLLNYLRHFWGVSGRARETIQTALLRKFLDYSEDVRSQVDHTDIIMATTRDSFELVEGGLLKTLVFVKQMGAVFMLVLFQFVAPPLFNRPFRLWLLTAVVSVPALMWVLAMARFAKSSMCLERRYKSALQLTSIVHETVVCYPIIADYNRRPVFVENFDRLIAEHNRNVMNAGCVLANDASFALWITTLAVSAFTLYGGMLVIGGSMTLGMFLASIKIFRDVGDTSQEVYRVWLEMQEVLPSLARITRLLNLPIDIDERKAISDLREKISRETLDQVPAEERTEVLHNMPITLQDINIGFCRADRPMQMSGKATIHPGSLVAIIGPRNTGKSTLMKILGGAILPQPQDFFIPSHLVTLHVQLDQYFFGGSLMDNLLFGYNGEPDDAAKSRALRICRRLGLAEDVLRKIESLETLPWSSVLSVSQKALINLARALIANPHILVIQRPTDYMDEACGSAIMALLREFVEKRGLEQDVARFPLLMRPPHTCIISTASFMCVEKVDEVICVSKTSGISNVPKGEVTESMFV